MHTLNSHRVESLMVANGEIVRHQPVNTLPTYELARRVDQLMNTINQLTTSLGLTVYGNTRLRYNLADAQFDRAEVLTHLAQLQFEILSLELTLGVGRVAPEAFDELYQSKLTELWPDGKLHHTESAITYPPTRRLPDMHPVLATADAGREAVQAKLFAEPAPTEIIEDVDQP